MTTLFVSAFLDLREDRSSDKSIETCFQHFRTVAQTGIPILLFLSKSYDAYRDSLPSTVRVESLELEDLWTYQQIPKDVRMPTNRTAHHDTRNFMTLMNAKIELVRKGLDLDPSVIHGAWLDFSIAHVFRNPSRSLDRLCLIAEYALQSTCLAFPGCWPITNYDLYDGVHWRFCGGFFIGDRQSLCNFYDLFRDHFPRIIQDCLIWEVNVWTALERLNSPLFKPSWFKADHNDSIVEVPSTFLDVVACMTTIPSRIGVDCVKAVESLLPQVSRVYIAISPIYARFPDVSMVIPEALLLNDRVVLVTMEDKGPANKYLVGLQVPTNKWILFCDDDQEYYPDLVSRMLSSVREKAVYQNRYRIIRDHTSGGLVHGYVGNLCPRSFLNGLESFDLPECSRHTDDQWLSIFHSVHSHPIRPTALEDYRDIFKVLEGGHERQSVDSLASLGTREARVQQVARHFGVRFTGDSECDCVVRFLVDCGTAVGLSLSPQEGLEGYQPSSASYCEFQGRKYLNIRYVNYIQTPEGRYIINDPNGHLKTENVLVVLGSAYEILNTHKMTVRTDLPTKCSDIQGLEDVRLYDMSGSLHFIATQKQWSECGYSRMSVGSVEDTSFTHMTVLEPPFFTGCEKNWIPFENGFIYKWFPFQKGSLNSNRLEIQNEMRMPSIFERVRGSTVFVPLPLSENEFIGVVHFSVETVPRHYYHMLVVLKDGVPHRYTSPFVFGRIGIEFCLGFTVDKLLPLVEQGSTRGINFRFWYSQHDRDIASIVVPMTAFIFVPVVVDCCDLIVAEQQSGHTIAA